MGQTHPFSYRAAFMADKVRLEEEVLTKTSQIRMIGNIFCSGGGGGFSAKSTTPKKGAKMDETRELQQIASRQKRLEHELAQLRAANVQLKRACDDAGGRSSARAQYCRSVSPPFKPSRARNIKDPDCNYRDCEVKRLCRKCRG